MVSSIRIGSHNLQVPNNHIYLSPSLPPTYDYLPWNLVGAILRETGMERSALIDIGANVGDSVAHFRRFSKERALCIEPDPTYFSLLSSNVELLCDVDLRNALVTPHDLFQKTAFGSNGSTGWSLPAQGADAWQGTYMSVREALTWADGPVILKTDTDGFDGFIVRELLQHLGKHFVPIVFFEGPLESQHLHMRYDEHLAACDGLIGLGYKLLLLTNAGMPYAYVGTSKDALWANMNALTIGLRQNRALCHYFDIIALHPALNSELHALKTVWGDELFKTD